MVEQEGFVDLSNVMLVDSAEGKPSRIRVKGQGDQKNRVFVRSGETVPDPVGQ